MEGIVIGDVLVTQQQSNEPRHVRKYEQSPKARILEAFSKFAETSRRSTGSAIGAPEQTSHSSPLDL